MAVGGGTDGTVPVTEAAPGTIVSALMAPARGLIVCLFSQALFFYFSVILFPLIRFLQRYRTDCALPVAGQRDLSKFHLWHFLD